MKLKPKYSLGSWAFSFGPFAKAPWSFDAFCDYARDAGYDGVEINGFRPHPHPADYATPAKRRELKAQIAGRGLGISGYAPDFTAVPPAEVKEQEYLTTVSQCLDFCRDLDIKIVRVDTVSPPANHSPEEYEHRFERLCRTWRAAAEKCQQAGVMLVWEFEPGFWLNKLSEVLRLLQTVDHPAFKALFDSSHAYMSGVVGARQSGERETLAGGVNEFAQLLRGHIGHVHFIDSDGTLHHDETSTHAPFGTGFVDFVSLLQTMRPDLERLKWWCFDFCFCSTTQRDARSAIAFMNAVVARLNSSASCEGGPCASIPAKW